VLKKKVNFKIQTSIKTKRIRDLPDNYNALKSIVEAMLIDERPQPSTKDYVIKYEDLDHEMINVSDDEDLYTAYEVAGSDLGGNLKFVIDLKAKAVA